MSEALETWRVNHFIPEVPETIPEILTLHGQLDNPPDLALYLVLKLIEEGS